MLRDQLLRVQLVAPWLGFAEGTQLEVHPSIAGLLLNLAIAVILPCKERAVAGPYEVRG